MSSTLTPKLRSHKRTTLSHGLKMDNRLSDDRTAPKASPLYPLRGTLSTVLSSVSSHSGGPLTTRHGVRWIALPEGEHHVNYRCKFRVNAAGSVYVRSDNVHRFKDPRALK